VREDFARIHCVIVVEKRPKKKIVICKGASRLKEIGRSERDIEAHFWDTVHLELLSKDGTGLA